MQFPKLTPLQSRFAACLGTTLLLLIIYFSISPPQFAYAAELDSIPNEDHNHHRIELDLRDEIDWGDDDDLEERGFVGYEPEFGIGLDRGLVGRATVTDIVILQNNQANQLNIQPGQTFNYVFKKEDIFGTDNATQSPTLPPSSDKLGFNNPIQKRSLQLEDEHRLEEEEHENIKRQNGNKTVFVAVNTCSQPSSNGSSTSPIPQLTVFVSTSDNNQRPGPGASGVQSSFPLEGGLLTYNTTVSSNTNVYIGVSASNLTGVTGDWNFQLAVSLDGFFFNFRNNQTSFVLDTDDTSALLSTTNLTKMNETEDIKQQWLDLTPPFQMFVVPANSTAINGLQNSYCAMARAATSDQSLKISTSILERGQDTNTQPKQQFLVDGLQPGTNYTAVLGYNSANGSINPANGVVGGGGLVWDPIFFQTKKGKLPYQCL
jgi:calcium channel MID1